MEVVPQKMHAPRVAVIIIAWNNKDILADCIASVENQTYEGIDTFLVDNDSSDGTVEFIQQDFPKVFLIQSGSNLGFAKGNNLGFAQAIKHNPDYEYFVLLNSDARLKEDWVETIVEFADKKPKGALFQSLTLDYYDHNVIDSTHIYLSRNGQGTQGNWRRPYTGERGPVRVFGVNAAACVISRRFIEAQPLEGVFDEKMFMYLEDVDLSARALILGWDNYLVPGTRAYHMGSASSGKNPGFSLYMTFRNNSAVLMKNLPFAMIIRILPSLIRGDYYTVKHLMKQNKSSAARKVIKGRLVGLLRLPIYFSDAATLSRHRVIDNDYLYGLLKHGNF